MTILLTGMSSTLVPPHMMSVNKVVAELAPAEAVASLEMTESLHQYKDLNNDAGSCEADGKRKKNALKTSYEYICEFNTMFFDTNLSFF